VSIQNIALSGLAGSNKALSTVANNIANTDTVAFKASDAIFGNLATSDKTGAGTSILGIKTDFTQGGQTSTGRALDMMIDGNGYFVVSKEGSDTDLYTRNGQFSLDAEGNLVTTSGLSVQGYKQNANGQYPLNPENILIPSNYGTPEITDSVVMDLNLKSSGDSFSTSVAVYDSLGAQNNMDLNFTNTGANAWDVSYELDGTTYGPFAINFATTGEITAAPVHTLAIPGFSSGAGAQNIDIDLTALTQFEGSHSVNSINTNGYGIGSLESIEITSEGIISANYSNGQSIQDYKLAMVTFPNDDGLVDTGNGNYAAGYAAGTAKLSGAGENGVGNVISSALESSNVDLTNELVSLITYQKSFKASSKVISTASQLDEATLNMTR